MYRVFGPIIMHAFVSIRLYVLIIIILISMSWRSRIISANCYFSGDIHVFPTVIHTPPKCFCPIRLWWKPCIHIGFFINRNKRQFMVSGILYITKDLIEHIFLGSNIWREKNGIRIIETIKYNDVWKQIIPTRKKSTLTTKPQIYLFIRQSRVISCAQQSRSIRSNGVLQERNTYTHIVYPYIHKP